MFIVTYYYLYILSLVLHPYLQRPSSFEGGNVARVEQAAVRSLDSSLFWVVTGCDWLRDGSWPMFRSVLVVKTAP